MTNRLPMASLIIVVGVLLCITSYAEDPDEQILTRIQEHIPKLTNRRGDRLPILIWESPNLPTGIENHTVRETQSVFLDRGLLPLCNRCANRYQVNRYLPVFQYWKERDFPVCFLPQGWMETPFVRRADGPSKIDHQPPAAQSADFPCAAQMLEIVSQRPQSTDIENVLTTLKGNSIDVKLIVVDWESGPYLRFKYEETQWTERAAAEAAKCPHCQIAFDRNSFENPTRFAKLTDQVRSGAAKKMLCEPVRQFYPDASIGNFFTWPINRAPATSGHHPAYGFENSGLNVLMPCMYMNAGWGGAHRNQSHMNWNAFHYCLDAFSPAAAVRKPGELLIPWPHTYLGGTYLYLAQDARALPEPWVMAEMARHMLLRGAETFAIWVDTALGEYPVDYPHQKYAKMGQLVYDVAGIQAGYNEMLAHNDFLRQAQPMTFEVPGKPNELNSTTACWSGMKSTEKALVRTISFDTNGQSTGTIQAFGKSYSLPFGSRGRSWWLFPDGRVEELPR